jgi:hypothetical protein
MNYPYFPIVGHYDGQAIYRVNELYEVIFGVPKFENWIHFNDAIVHQSPYCIV